MDARRALKDIHSWMHRAMDALCAPTITLWQARLVKILSEKANIPVVFRIDSLATWDKKRTTYVEMLANPRFTPRVAVTSGKWTSSTEVHGKELATIIEELRSDGVDAVDAMQLGPSDFIGRYGIVIDDDPWEYNKPRKWRTRRFDNYLRIIVPYTMGMTHRGSNYALSRPFRQAWHVYYPTQMQADISREKSYRARVNGKYVGYPISDILAKGSRKKIRGTNRVLHGHHECPTIVWAPHFAASARLLRSGSFFEWQELLLGIAREGTSDLCWVFRPHPKLRSELEREWGAERTTRYFLEWEKSGTVSYGKYAELLSASSGLLHDSKSFLGEYLFTEKPVAFLQRKDGRHLDNLNSIGKSCLEAHYSVSDALELDTFIDVVLGKAADSMSDTRKEVLAHLGGERTNVAKAIVRDIDCELSPAP